MTADGTRAKGAGSHVALLVCWLLAALPFAFAPERWSGLSRAALAALPWIAWAGVPRTTRGSGSDALCEAALFVPVLGLGAWIDLASGVSTRAVAAIALVGAALGLALAWATRRAGPSRGYALAWFLVVPLAPILSAALTWGGAPGFGPGPAWLSLAARASPLAWVLDRLASDGAASETVPWSALAGVAVLASTAAWKRARLAPGAAT